MSKEMSPASAVFLERFFGEHNELKLEEIETGSGAAGVLLPWVTRLKLVNPLPTIVARKFVDDEGLARYTWYGVAQTQRELRDLSEDLTAFVGPTWSTFRGDRATLNAADPTDVAVQEFTNGLAFKFSGNNKKIWDSLELMRDLWERRKTLELEDLRPPGRVLRDFFMALQASNRESAESALRILRDNHGYDAINISFLKIQMLASLERWGELLDSPNFSDILQVRRPVAVTQALISAVYHSELMRFEEQQDPIAARDYFRGSVLPRYGSLFSVHAGMRTPEALKSFMLFAISAEPPMPGLRDQIMALPDLQSDEKSYLQDIANLLTASPPKYDEDLLAQAKELLWSGEYDQAFQVAFDAPESAKRAQILLQCAYELQTLTSERAAIAAFKKLPAEDQQSLTTMRSTRAFLERFSTVAPETDVPLNLKAIPDGWLAWLSQLYEDSTWTRAMEVARQGAEEWDINSLLDEPNGISELAQRLGSYPSAAEATLHNSLPFFLEFFRRDEQYPRRECQSVYNVLLDLLTISTYGGDDDLNLFNELVLALLSLGLDSPKYSSVIENAEDLWGRYASPSKTDWILDLLDSLTIYPSPTEEKRRALLSFVANKITEFARRVEPAQWDFLALLASDLREESLVALVNEYRKPDEIQASVPAADLYTRLAGKSIAIYTLTEAVAQRVKSIIQTRCGSAVVHLCHDKVGSERLRQLARSADIFIMATASAKHAATGFIEAHRAEGEPLLRPSGKGSASMLRALHSYIVAELTPT